MLPAESLAARHAGLLWPRSFHTFRIDPLNLLGKAKLSRPTRMLDVGSCDYSTVFSVSRWLKRFLGLRAEFAGRGAHHPSERVGEVTLAAEACGQTDLYQ